MYPATEWPRLRPVATALWVVCEIAGRWPAAYPQGWTAAATTGC